VQSGREGEVTTSWKGRFSWQDHAQTGRPDFLNYLNAGDVTWEELWQFFRAQPPAEEAGRSLSRLFHAFLSSQYDAAGCWLEPEGEVYGRLRAWAEFVLDGGQLRVADQQADLARLIGSGLVTSLYYQAVYTVFTETSVDRLANEWPAAEAPSRRGCEDLPEPGDRFLPIYHPGACSHPHLSGDATWSATLRSHLITGYTAWNGAFAEHLPDQEEEEAWSTVGGEA